MTPLLFHPNFGVFPLEQIANVWDSPSKNLKLTSREFSKYSNLCDYGT